MALVQCSQVAFQLALDDGKGQISDGIIQFASNIGTTGIILGHGAGGNRDTGKLPQLSQRFAQEGFPCVRWSIKGPNLAQRVKYCQAFLDHAKDYEPLKHVRRWIMAGHSMGGRVASEVAHKNKDAVAACIFFSYPMHPPNQPSKLRDDPLVHLQQPLLFIRGTSDEFGTPGPFNAVQKRLQATKVKVHEVPGGDHSLKVKGGAAKNAEVVEEFTQVAVDFAKGCSEQTSTAHKAGPSHGEPTATAQQEDNSQGGCDAEVAVSGEATKTAEKVGTKRKAGKKESMQAKQQPKRTRKAPARKH